MKWIVRIFFAVIFVVVAIPTIWIGALWFKAGAIIAEAERAGRMPAWDAPLSTVERTIAISEYADTWDTRAAPCRIVATLWRAVTSGGHERVHGGRAVSAALARAIDQPPERSIHRHFEEVAIACRLEQSYDDRAMLRAWLSDAYFGQQPLGIEHAAQTYFGKAPNDLNAEESAHLAALLRSPRIHRDPERWTEHARRVSARVALHDRARDAP